MQHTRHAHTIGEGTIPDVCHMKHNKPRSAQTQTYVHMYRARCAPDYSEVTAETCGTERERERDVLLCTLGCVGLLALNKYV